MDEPDYDDPEVEEAWCLAERQRVIDYLATQPIEYNEVGEWPAWFVPPIVAIWAIESAVEPNAIGYWAISGDLPTDFISGYRVVHPREAMAAFADQWDDVADHMERKVPHPEFVLGRESNWHELAPLLRARAKIFREWVADDDLWEDE
ncbi:MAG: DUF4826 family protein [Armatimonadetes bacterium]|nr:DUF4826 family protein [Armatimonadota bacterium]